MSDSFFKAIADANRRKILLLLKKHTTLTPGEIAQHFEFSGAALSEHLKILRTAGLIYAQKRGQYIYYSLNTSVFEDIISWIMQVIDKSEVTDEKTK
ncbi:MAG: autorepressor SdpR family transcription factor [Candidatus Cloacimonetes bacterium]|nr:autorepressor SdpR family transcription factor [Candidatus Cloacimonadota bacterium]